MGNLILRIVALLLVVLIAAYFYYWYTPKVEEPPLLGQLYEYDIEVGQDDRRFRAYVPANVKPAAPLVFVLHGSLRRGDLMRTSTAYRFDQLADQYGFVVLYPDGIDRHWNDCRASADYVANVQDIDDPSFFSRMIEFASKQWEVDTSAVFVTGISNGGHMAFRLAMERPQEYQAIAVVAANLPVQENRDCENLEQAIAVAIFNGTEDAVNPYEGGLVSLFGNETRGYVLSTEQTMRYWLGLADINWADSEITEHAERDGNAATVVLEQRWQGGAYDQQFRLYQLTGSGHVFPLLKRRFPRLLGTSAGDVSGPEEIVDFFYSTLGRNLQREVVDDEGSQNGIGL